MGPYITDALLTFEIVLRHLLHGGIHALEIFDLFVKGILGLAVDVCGEGHKDAEHEHQINKDDTQQIEIVLFQNKTSGRMVDSGFLGDGVDQGRRRELWETLPYALRAGQVISCLGVLT